MIDTPFRAWLASRVSPLLAAYRRLGLSPNQVTLLGCGFGIFSAVSVACEQNGLALFLWWFGRLLDGTDGIYARATNRVSDFGGYLDILADMFAYGIMTIGFAVARPEFHWHWMAMLFLYILCITSALAVGSLERREGLDANDNRSLRLAAGLAEGGETGIVYSLLLVFSYYTETIATIWIVVLTTTVVARSWVAKRELVR